MLVTLKEAFYFCRNQIQPLLIIGLVYAIPAFFIKQSGMMATTTESGPNVLAIFIVMCLNLLPFASAILYIDAISQGRPIGIGASITQGLSKLGWLIVLNVLLGAIVGVGLIMLIVPGIFFAYKLLFAELYLLLHKQGPMESLKSSYVGTTGMFSDIVPPLLVWFGSTLLASMFVGRLTSDMDAWVGGLIYTGAMLPFSIYGWALIYRLYQRYIEAQIAIPED